MACQEQMSAEQMTWSVLLTRNQDLETSSDEGDVSDSDSSKDSFDGKFGIQDPPNIYVVFNPPVSTDSELSRLRSRNQRTRLGRPKGFAIKRNDCHDRV